MEIYSEKMLAALDQQDLEEANRNLKKAIQNDPPEYLANLGEELFHLGFLEEAQTVFEHLERAVPDEDGWQINLAEIAIENGDADQAIAHLDRISKDSDNYPTALLTAADLYQTLGMPEVSEQKLKEAAELLPQEAVITFSLGELFYSQGKYLSAIVYYEQLLAAGVNEMAGVSVEERLGFSLSSLGDFEEALPHLERALAEKETEDRLFYLAFTNEQLHEHERAINEYEKLRALNPRYTSLYPHLGKLLQEEDRLEEAQTVLLEGIREDPYQAELFRLAADNSYWLHDAKKSEELLRQGLALGEKNDELNLALGNLLLEQERFDEAITTLLAVEGEDPYAKWELAQAYQAQEDYENAGSYYAQAAKELVNEPDFLKDYGLFLRDEGAVKQAQELFKKYLTLVPGDLEIESLLDDSDQEG